MGDLGSDFSTESPQNQGLPRELLRFYRKVVDDPSRRSQPCCRRHDDRERKPVSTGNLANSLVGPVDAGPVVATTTAMRVRGMVRPVNTPISACSWATSPATSFRSKNRSGQREIANERGQQRRFDQFADRVRSALAAIQKSAQTTLDNLAAWTPPPPPPLSAIHLWLQNMGQSALSSR